jgi:alpha-glucosidase
MMKSTYSAVSDIFGDNRTFVLTKGSFAGTGRYASQAHQTQVATYDTLYYALQSAIRSQLFSMSHSGVDIACNGTKASFDQELCVRFYQLVAWLPLARHVYTNPESAPYNFT